MFLCKLWRAHFLDGLSLTIRYTRKLHPFPFLRVIWQVYNIASSNIPHSHPPQSFIRSSCLCLTFELSVVSQLEESRALRPVATPHLHVRLSLPNIEKG